MEKIKTILKIVMTILTLLPSTLLKACEVVSHVTNYLIEKIEQVIKPICDKTKTNKDNKIQEKVTAFLEEMRDNINDTIIPFIGRVESFFNRFGL